MNPTTPPTPTQPPLDEPSGIHLIGKNDPRVMTASDFINSGEILYHPCQQAFTFTQQHDGSLPEYYLEGNTTQTLGQGFYTTPDRQESEMRSQAKIGLGAAPIIMPLLPYQARVFDFRSRNNPQSNGAVPLSMAQRWLLYFTDYYRAPEHDNLPWIATEPEDRYFAYLKNILTSTSLDLRTMLGTASPSGAPQFTLPSWSKVFSNFIMREGMDGIIYNEESLAHPGQTSTIVVFYALSKIGTFESWHAGGVSDPNHPS
jgi:hypothetical protein